MCRANESIVQSRSHTGTRFKHQRHHSIGIYCTVSCVSAMEAEKGGARLALGDNCGQGSCPHCAHLLRRTTVIIVPPLAASKACCSWRGRRGGRGQQPAGHWKLKTQPIATAGHCERARQDAQTLETLVLRVLKVIEVIGGDLNDASHSSILILT